MIRLLMVLYRQLGAERGSTLLRVLWLTVALIAYSSSGFMYFELDDKPDLQWGDAVWWALVTMTTVGYGDLFPTTTAGRYLVGVPTMLFGVAVLGYVLSVIATFLIEATSKKRHGLKEILVDDHILVIHYPSLDKVLGLVSELRADPATAHRPVVLVDPDLEVLPDALDDLGVAFVRGDPTWESTLEQANFQSARHAIILARDPNDPYSDNHTLAAALTLEHLRPELVTVAECVEPVRVGLLKRSGCDAVICIAEMTAGLLVSEVQDPGLNAVISDLVSAGDDGQQMFLIPIAASGTVEKVKAALEQQRCLFLGVQRAAGIEWNPEASAAVGKGEQAIAIGATRPSGGLLA